MSPCHSQAPPAPYNFPSKARHPRPEVRLPQSFVADTATQESLGGVGDAIQIDFTLGLTLGASPTSCPPSKRREGPRRTSRSPSRTPTRASRRNPSRFVSRTHALCSSEFFARSEGTRFLSIWAPWCVKGQLPVLQRLSTVFVFTTVGKERSK